MIRIDIQPGHELRLFTEDDFSAIWEDYGYEDQQTRLKDYQELLEIGLRDRLIDSIERTPDHLTLKINRYLILFALMEICAISFGEILEQLAPFYPELQPYLADNPEITDIRYGCIINGHRFRLEVALTHQAIIIDEAP